MNDYDRNKVWRIFVSEHVDDVRAIVQKAVKDLAIDQSLKTYDEIWTSKLFELRLHTRVRTEQELMTVPVSIVDYMTILVYWSKLIYWLFRKYRIQCYITSRYFQR